jgi:hypothetical protein
MVVLDQNAKGLGKTGVSQTYCFETGPEGPELYVLFDGQ